jgi:serine/threonine protein kinase/Flp pilus assembly protein TadD
LAGQGGSPLAPRSHAPDTGSGTLGDFRLLREVGRGGMGVVYEAEQISLGRRVALKVLPFASTLDSRHLQRFKNEAHAAAQLHHTNIVPVFATGCERGVHFYAMQYVEGQTLAQMIADLRSRIADLRKPVELPSGANSPTGPYVPQSATCDLESAMALTPPVVGRSTERSAQTPAYFRTVAHLGIQAAEALEHAHQLGIIHRDIKPGNLLIEQSPAPANDLPLTTYHSPPRLWVTDFGLAHVQSQAGLTMTGDLLGTLRYMSPEQALAQRVPVDQRTDIYSLGVTLYELLTLEPAFRGTDRQELLRQIAFEEPKAPRRLNRAVPPELDTIVGKAMEKNPADRYATAQEMADDLERYLKDEPIRARRPTLMQRARKWSRRHRHVVWSAAVCLIVAAAVLASAAGWLMRDRAAQREKVAGDVRAALKEADTLRRQARPLIDNPYQWFVSLAAARSALQRAEALAGPVEGLDPAVLAEITETKKQLLADERDRDFVARFEDIRMQATEVDVVGNRFKLAEAYARLKHAFEPYGIHPGATPARAVVDLIRQRPLPIQHRLRVALLYWYVFTRHPNQPDWEWYQAVATAGDVDPWWAQALAALNPGDWPKLKELLRNAPVERQPPALLILLATRLSPHLEPTKLELLGRVQSANPGDFWANFEYALALAQAHPPRCEEAIRYYSAAVALRPDNPGAHLNLGSALNDKGETSRAIAEFHKALILDPKLAAAHHNLALALEKKGLRDEAIAEYRAAFSLREDWAEAHCNLAQLLLRKGELQAGIEELRRGHELGSRRPDWRYPSAKRLLSAHTIFGVALAKQGKLDEAIAEYRKALTLNRKPGVGQKDLEIEALAEAHYNLANALEKKGLLDEAIAEYREVIRLGEDLAEAHCNLGQALLKKGQLEQAVQELRRGHELGSRRPDWRYPSAAWIRNAEQLIALDAKLPKVLRGEVQPADAAERLALAWLCQMRKKLYATATRLYAEAFAAQRLLADDLKASHRYNAACAAALAGCGQGEDAATLPSAERARLRQQGLDWLRADLASHASSVDGGPAEARAFAQVVMQRWQRNTDLAGVRGTALAKLPEAERQAWGQLWVDVEQTLRKTKQKDTKDTKKKASD